MDKCESNADIVKRQEIIHGRRITPEETIEKIEIVSPKFSTSDKFLLTGNYGLADTAKIKIIKQ